MNLINRTFAFKRLMLMGFTFYGLTACNGGANNPSATSGSSSMLAASNSAIVNSSLYLMRMGDGYDSVTHTVTSGQSCLVNAATPENSYVTNPIPLVTFENSTNMSTLQSALNVDVVGQYGGGRFGTDISAKFANSSKDTKYTTNLLYLYEYAGKSVFKDGSLGQGVAALTPYAAELEAAHPTDFRDMCGDEFIEQMDAGAVLAIRLSLNFNSHSDQEQFAAQMKTNLGLANVSAAIQQAASNSNVHVDMTLSALQQGGQPQKLNELFGQPDSAGNYPFLKCESQDGEAGSQACDLMISNIISYAQTLEAQLSNADGSMNLDRLYYTNPVVTPYSHLGITGQGAPDPSAEILAAMQKLTHDYDKAVFDYNFVSHYLTILSAKLDNSARSNLEDAKRRLNNQINNVYLLPAYDVADCYKGYVSTRCLQIQANVDAALVPFALTDPELSLVDYLENNSYTGALLNYYGGETPSASDYKMHLPFCTLAPVSSSSRGYYAINCDGKWLDTAMPNGVTLMLGFAGSTLSINNFGYISTPPNSSSNGQLITYANMSLPADAADPQDYFSNLVKIIAPGFSATDATLELVREAENEA